MKLIPKLKFEKCPPFEREKHLNFNEEQIKFYKSVEKYCAIATEKQIEFLIDIIKPYYENQSKESLGFPLKYNLT